MQKVRRAQRDDPCSAGVEANIQRLRCPLSADKQERLLNQWNDFSRAADNSDATFFTASSVDWSN